MEISDYPEWELKPRKLLVEEIENPYQVINDFFWAAHLPEIRDMMWQLLKTLVSGDFSHTLTRKERSDMIGFYELLEKLVEAVHIIFIQQEPVAGQQEDG